MYFLQRRQGQFSGIHLLILVLNSFSDGSALEEKLYFKMLGLTFSSKLDWGSYITSIAKTVSKKIGSLVGSRSFFLLRLLCSSINLPYSHAWNTVVMSGLVFQAGTWNC